ncbi:hypothetical protein QF002_001540 [Paraburkholderia youngii]
MGEIVLSAAHRALNLARLFGGHSDKTGTRSVDVPSPGPECAIVSIWMCHRQDPEHTYLRYSPPKIAGQSGDSYWQFGALCHGQDTVSAPPNIDESLTSQAFQPIGQGDCAHMLC